MKWAIVSSIPLLVAGCVVSSVNQQHYSSLEQFMLINSAQTPDPRYDAAANEQITKCLSRALVMDIPYEDQTAMLAVINARRFTEESDQLFIKWFGRPVSPQAASDTVVQTRVMNVGTANEYKEFLTADDIVVRSTESSVRASRNAHQICPDTVAQYPAAFEPGNI